MAAMAAQSAATALHTAFATTETTSSAPASSSGCRAANGSFWGRQSRTQELRVGSSGTDASFSRKFVEKVERGRGGNFKGVRVVRSSAGVMEGAPPVTREQPVVVEVDLGDRSYPIYIGAGLLNQPELLQKHVKGKKVTNFCERIDTCVVSTRVFRRSVSLQIFSNPIWHHEVLGGGTVWMNLTEYGSLFFFDDRFVASKRDF